MCMCILVMYIDDHDYCISNTTLLSCFPLIKPSILLGSVYSAFRVYSAFDDLYDEVYVLGI